VNHARDPFLHQLIDVCDAQPTRAKWVFVPTHALGHTLGERLVREGTNWLNLRFVTPLDIALRMGAPFLVERGIDPSEEDLGPALMMRLLLDQPEEGGYFRPLADHPTLAHVLWRTVRELRMAGLGVRDLAAEAFNSPGKHRELCALLAAYEQHLATHARADMATVYEEALRHCDWCPIQAQDCWTLVPDVVWAPLLRALFDALPGERIVPRALDLPGVARPRRLRDRDVERVAPEPANPLAFLLDPAQAGGARDRIDIFHAGGREAEIDEVFRRILASGRPLDEVEIACAIDDCALLAWEKALRLDWAVTAGTGIPATQTKPGRALLAFCAWIEGDFPAGVLRRLLQSGNIAPPLGDLTRGQAATLLARAEAGWGRATYDRALRRLAGRYAQRAADPNLDADVREAARQRAAHIENLHGWVETLLQSIPEPDVHGLVDLRPVVDATTTFLETCAARTSALDAAARIAIEGSVRELSALGAFRCPLPAALRFVRERVEGLVVAPDRPRPGHLHVTRLTDAGCAGRPLTFIVGLEEGRVFPAAVEDPILLDAEREAISPALSRSSDRTEESVAAVVARLAVCGGGSGARMGIREEPIDRSVSQKGRGNRSAAVRQEQPGLFDPPPAWEVCFSYSCRDTRESRETFPSWLVLQAFRLRTGRPTASYPELHAALGAPRSVVPGGAAGAVSDAGWWLTQVKAAGPRALTAVLRAFPSLQAGRVAEEARESEDFTEFDGHVPEAGRALDPARPDRVVSATQLEAAAGCPFRHFLARGLGLRALDDGERDPDVWLDPLTRGAELHDLYAALLRRCRQEGRAPGVANDRAWLHACAEARLDVLRCEMPPASSEVFAREREELLRDLDLFLDGEVENARTRTPVGLEVSFGQSSGDEDESLARVDPVVVPIGGGLTLRLSGRIDRIDEVGLATFEVVDYKTGAYWDDAWQGVFAGGTRLQHALYGLAVVELLKQTRGRVSMGAGVYYFPSARGRQERVRIPHPSQETIEAVLSDLREVIASGAFVHAPEEEACRWCDFGAACGPRVHERAARKLGDAKLAAVRRLRAHV
jgi:ATP-dependent helicase/nuclease subunit B